MRRSILLFLPILLLVICPVGPARGDEVLFLNGDRLTGKILKATGGKLTIKTEGAGDVVVDMSKVKTFSTDAPVAVGVKEQPVGELGRGRGTRSLRADRARSRERHRSRWPSPTSARSTPPRRAWTGSFSLNGLVTSGNSETEQVGFRGALSKRWPRDRLTFGAEYYLRPSGGPGHRRQVHHRRLRHGAGEVRSLLDRAFLWLPRHEGGAGRGGGSGGAGGPRHRRRLPVVREPDLQSLQRGSAWCGCTRTTSAAGRRSSSDYVWPIRSTGLPSTRSCCSTSSSTSRASRTSPATTCSTSTRGPAWRCGRGSSPSCATNIATTRHRPPAVTETDQRYILGAGLSF